MQQAQPSNRRESVATNRRRSSSAAASTATPAFPWSKKQLQLSTPFFPRKYLAATPAFSESQNGPVYLFGGASDTSLHNDLIALDPISLTQSLVPNGANSSATPSPRRGHSMAYMQGHLYVFGGTDHTGQASDDALYVYDIANNMWMRPNLFSHSPQCRHMHSVSVVGTKMYIFGGMTHGYYLNDVVVFDSANLQLQPSWQFVEPANEVPPGRTGHSSVVYQEKLYIFGGTDGLKVFDDLWCYDTRNNTWQCIKGSGYVPPSRYGHATCIVQDVMYVFGGRNGAGQGLNDLFAYRFAANRWFTFQKMGPAPSARAGACLVACGSKVLVFGGSHSDDPPSVVSCLDTSKIRYPPDPVPVRSNPQVNESVRTGPRTSSVPSLAGNLNMKRLTSLMPGRNGFGPPPSNKPVPPGVSQRRESIIESPRQVQEALQEVPQSSGSQRPLPPAPSSGNAQPDRTPTLTNLPERRQSIQNLSLLQSRAPPQRKESRIIEESVPNEELEAKNEELKALKNKLNWLSAEFYSARKGSEEKDMNSLMDNAGRAGQDGEKAAIYAVMLKLRKELKDTKAMIAQTSSEQAKRLAEFEHIRTAALCEAAYQKSRADALAEENKGAFESVDMERTRTLETRLVDVLKEHEKQTVELESLRAQAQKHSEVARHADAARRGVEERAERALKGRTELEERLRVAEAKVSDLSSGGVDVRETLKKSEHLERSLAEQGSALALAAQILEAANKRADDAESKSESVQTSNFQLQKECGVMRTKMAELESENTSLKTYAVESKSMLIKLKERAESESTLLNTIKSWKSNETLSRSPSVESETVQRKLAVQNGKHESDLLTEKQLREAAEKRNRDLETMYERARDDALSMRDECRLRAEEITVARMESESIASRLKATVAALQVVTMKTENGIDVKDMVVGDIEMSEPLREKVAALERKSAKAVEESREMEALHAEAQEEICLMTERNQELESKIQSLVSQNSSNSPDALTARAEEAERQLAATKTSLQAKASKLEKDTYQAIQMVKASESKLLSMQAQLEEARSAAKESEKRKMLAEAEAEQEREKYEKASRRLAETTTVAMNAQSGDSTLVKEREAWESTKQVLEKRITMLAEMSATGSQDDVSVKELEAMNRALEARHEELKSELAIAIEGRAALERKVQELLEIQRNGDSCREELEATLEKVQSLDQELAKVKSSERAHYQRGMQSEKAASQLASRMAALSQEIAEANDRIEELTAENQTLLAEIKEMDRGRSSDSQSQAQEIIRANQRFEQLARDHQELLAVLGEMETKLEEAKSESQSQESNEEVEKLLAELEQMETRLEESDRNLADSQAQATEEIAQGKEKIEELTREHEKLLSQLEEIGTKDSESHAQEIARANEQVEEMNQVHETLLAELEGMEIKLEAAEKSHADSQTRTSEEIAECKSRFEELSREHQDLLGQLEEMETKLGEADQSLADSQTKAAEDIAQANARIEELTQERETLVADINAADQDSENRAIEELTECKTRIEELTCEQEELVNQLDEMQAKLEEADQSLVESQAKAAEEIAEANAQIEELNVEREKLVADINAMETDMESKDRGLTDAESQANELMTTQAELATATEKLWEADQRYEESTRVIRETEEELESLRREHGDLSEAAEGLKQRVAELLEEQEVSTREHAEKQESLQQEHRDALQVIEGLEQQVAEFSEQRESSTQLIQETEAKLELLREAHREALEEAAALRQQVDDLTKEREISTQQIKEGEEKLESLREEHRGESEGVGELAQKVADLMEEREISTRVIQEAEEKLQTLLEEHRVVLEGSAELKQQIAGLLEVKSVTTQLIQDNEEQLESLRKEYIEAMEGANALKLQIAEISEDQAQKTVQLQSTISDLETQLAESKEATDDLEDELQRTSEVLQKNIEALAQQDETIETLNKKLKETELERDQAVEKVSVLDSRANEAATSRIEIQEKVAALHERLAKVRAKTAVELNEKDEVEE